MIEYLKELLEDIELNIKNDSEIALKNKKQKCFALKTAIKILEDIKYKERRIENGKK